MDRSTPGTGHREPEPPRLTQEELQRGFLDRGSSRQIEAVGPGPDAQATRAAYLDLLKLALCDLAGAHTLTVSRSGDGRATNQPLFTRELGEDELTLRAMGADWPFSGLTMVGMRRLDDLQRCVETIVEDEVPGDLIEAGAWRGGASILMRATLDALGAGRTVWVADSFEGLPKPDESFPEDHALDLSWLDYLAVSRDQVQRNFERFGLDDGVEFVEGFFEDTLPGLTDRTWSLLRLDGDTYESTWVALESLYPALSPGGYVVVDDYLLISECQRAVDEYRRQHHIEEPIERIDLVGVRWRRESDAAIEPPEREKSREPAEPQGERSVSREGGQAPIPTWRELQLERELEQARERLVAAERSLPRRIERRIRQVLGRTRDT
jgi:O-methyltransferase